MTTSPDPDKLMTLDEAVEVFGIPRRHLVAAISVGELVASEPRGRTPYLVRSDDVRAFAKKFLVDHQHQVPLKEKT